MFGIKKARFLVDYDLYVAIVAIVPVFFQTPRGMHQTSKIGARNGISKIHPTAYT